MEKKDTENNLKHKISIVTDSGTDLLPDEAEKLKVRLLPIHVRFDEKEYLDGVTISRDEFYEKLRPDHLAKTSLISPKEYEDCFVEELDAGNEVLCLTMSGDISGCYQSARIAAEKFEGKVRVIDTRHFCGSEQLLVKRAVALKEEGRSLDEMIGILEREKEEVQIIAVFDTLEYTRAGGRISAAKAAIGGLLSIKPVLTITDGRVNVLGKARGSKKCNNYLMEMVRQYGGIDWSRPILLSWSGNSKEVLEKYVMDSAVLYEGRSAEELPRSRVGATIGTYSGPGAIAFSFFSKKPQDF